MSNKFIKLKSLFYKLVHKSPSPLRENPAGFLIFAFILSYSTSSMAYVGPGAGITMLGALWAVVLGIIIALGGFLIWPIRAFLRRRKGTEASSIQNNTGESDKNSAE